MKELFDYSLYKGEGRPKMRTLLLGTLLLALPTSLVAQDIVAIGAGFAAMQASADKIGETGRSLIDAGNVAAGQQQVLMAATLRQTIEQTKKAYADSLDKTTRDLDAERQNTFNNLTSLVRSAELIEGKSVKDAQELIYSTSEQANNILGRLPGSQRYPVYFGTSCGEMLQAVNPGPFDLEILGFYLTDSKYPSLPPPTLKINDQIISTDPQNIATSFGRIRVKLPADLKTKLGLINSACHPPKSFRLSLDVHWSNYPTLAQAFSGLVETTSFSDFVEAGKPQYDVSIELTGTTSNSTNGQRPFDVGSGQRQIGCGQHISVPVSYTASEPGATIDANSVSMYWTGMDGHYKDADQGTPTINGSTVVATGGLSGADSTMFGCPGGGHGELRMKGTYSFSVTNEAPFDYTQSTVLSQEDVAIATPANQNTKATSLVVILHRRSCREVLDKATIPISDISTLGAKQNGDNGLFVAQYNRGIVQISPTKLLNNNN